MKALLPQPNALVDAIQKAGFAGLKLHALNKNEEKQGELSFQENLDWFVSFGELVYHGIPVVGMVLTAIDHWITPSRIPVRLPPRVVAVGPITPSVVSR